MLGGSLEENVLCALTWSDTLAPHIAISVSSADFSIQTYRSIARGALDYLTQYHRPAKTHLSDVLENELRRGPDGKFMGDVIDQMQRLAPHLNEDYVRSSLDRFVEVQRLIHAVNDASDLLRDDKLEEAREILRAPTLPKDKPGVWLRDTDEWLRFLREEDDVELFSTGIDVLDEHGVRPARGELMALLAASGMGKSWFLVQLSKHNVIGYRKNVLFVTLENSTDVTLQRFTQAFLALTRDEAKHIDVGIFHRPEHDDPTWVPHIGPREFEALHQLPWHELASRLKPYQSRGQLLIKHFATGTLTIGTLSAFLDSLEQSEEFRPDLVVLDYLTLMHMDARDYRISIGRTAQQLRGLAAMRNCAVVTVLQANREAAGKRLVYGTHTAEDWSLIGTCDTFLTYSQTMHERELHVARVLVYKARNSADKWIAFITQAYEIGQFCLDSVYMTADIKAQLNEAAPDTTG